MSISYTDCNYTRAVSSTSGESFADNFLSSKPAEFYLKGINKLHNKWQGVIKNNGKYTVEEN